MTRDAPGDFEERLHHLAVALIPPVFGPQMEVAVVLAEDLVAAGDRGEATLQVAVLPRDVILSDAEPLVRDMLAEHGIDLPVATDDNALYDLLLKAFASWNLPVGDFYGPFMKRIGTFDKQSPLDRNLLLMFEELDHTTSTTHKPAVIERMRDMVRDALA